MTNAQAAKYTLKIKKNGVTETQDFVLTVTQIPQHMVTQIPQHTVTYNHDGATSGVPANQKVDHGSTFRPPYPKKTGYTFDGWYTDAGHTFGYYIFNEVTEDITLYAKWVKDAPEDDDTPVYDTDGELVRVQDAPEDDDTPENTE